jgi:hypothetical protein
MIYCIDAYDCFIETTRSRSGMGLGLGLAQDRLVLARSGGAGINLQNLGHPLLAAIPSTLTFVDAGDDHLGLTVR